MKETKFLAECACANYHYVQVDVWDEGSGEVMLAFVEQPIGFWSSVVRAWQHRNFYVTDIILNKEQQAKLVEALTNSQE